MFRSIALVIVAASALCAGPVRSHDAAPDPGCIAPVRPTDEHNDVLWGAFVEDVDNYRQCISDFVQSNQDAAVAHNEAARQATEAWNAFVRTSLNLPEDFPWPPEAQ